MFQNYQNLVYDKLKLEALEIYVIMNPTVGNQANYYYACVIVIILLWVL